MSGSVNKEVKQPQTTQKSVTNQQDSLTFRGLSLAAAKRKIESCKAVNDPKDGKAAMEVIFPHIINMSVLGENDMTYLGVELSKIDIPDFIKDLILPAKVSVYGKRSDQDLLQHPEMVKAGTLSDFMEACEVVSSCISKRGTEGKTVTLESLKTVDLLSNVKNYSYQDAETCVNDLTYTTPLIIEVTKSKLVGMDVTTVAEDTFHDILKRYKA